jgi:hypothetical protein
VVSEKSEIALKPDVYADLMRVGLQVHKEIDVPGGEVYLRTGLYDLNSSKAGTLGIALGGLAGAQWVGLINILCCELRDRTRWPGGATPQR